nr:PREDICTED: lysine-rich arabinogalactan protein 19-like [Linepithema humile]
MDIRVAIECFEIRRRDPSSNRETSSLDKHSTGQSMRCTTTSGRDEYLTKSAVISLYTRTVYTPSRAAIQTTLRSIRVCSDDCRTASTPVHAPTSSPLLLAAPPPPLSLHTNTASPPPLLLLPPPSPSATTTTVVSPRCLHHHQQPPPPSPPRSPSIGQEAKGPEVSTLRVSWPT